MFKRPFGMPAARSVAPGATARRGHRPPGRRLVGRLAATGVVSALAVTGVMVTAGSASAASADDFARLRACESGGNYAINTGNGFYGAYQFDLQTWRGLGLSGRPDQASPATQDAAAARLQSQRGWQPWPACSAKLGLRGGGGGSVAAPAPAASSSSSSSAAAPSRASRSEVRTPVAAPKPAPVAPTEAPAFAGETFTQDMVNTYRDDVRQWQQRMADRGWHIWVDGYFGPQSSGIAQQFAAEKGLDDGAVGVVGPTVWAGAWTLPVT